MLVTERIGRLRIVSKDFRLDPREVEGLPKVVVTGQGGLFEVAVHPNYKENGWIYLSYNGPGDGGHGFDALALKGRLDDFRAPRAGSNQADADAVVGSQDALRSEQSARRNGTGAGNLTVIWVSNSSSNENGNGSPAADFTHSMVVRRPS